MIDIDTARSWHRLFSSHLIFGIAGIEPLDFDPTHASDDHACQLGQWLGSVEAKYAKSSRFWHLVEVHQRFHHHAADLVRLHQAGMSTAAAELESGAFEETSRLVLDALDAFAEEYAKQKTEQDTTYVKPCNGVDASLTWNSSLQIGVPLIDEQHQDIAKILNHLLRDPDQDTGRTIVISRVKHLESALKKHFSTEESFMRRLGVEEAFVTLHTRDHAHILEIISDICTDASCGAFISAREAFRRISQAFMLDLTQFDRQMMLALYSIRSSS